MFNFIRKKPVNKFINLEWDKMLIWSYLSSLGINNDFILYDSFGCMSSAYSVNVNHEKWTVKKFNGYNAFIVIGHRITGEIKMFAFEAYMQWRNENVK